MRLNLTHYCECMKKIKTILMGTSEFAEIVFRKFYPAMRDKIDIIAVVTAPDKPVGRKQELLPSPVKKWTVENNLFILQPEKINSPEWIKKIKEINPELIVLCAYGQIIPKEILDIPKLGALNIHPSLLPKHRGASPIQTTILNGDKEAGITIMLMDEKMDHGPILAHSKLQITNSKITYIELSQQLAELGAKLLIKTLPDWIDEKIKAQPQDHAKATFTKIIKKEDGKIDWNKSAEEIERQIRAYSVWPTAYTRIMNNKSRIMNLKILEANVENKNKNHKISEISLTEDKQLAVQTSNGTLILKQVQLEGKKPMPVKDFINGYSEIIGSILK